MPATAADDMRLNPAAPVVGSPGQTSLHHRHPRTGEDWRIYRPTTLAHIAQGHEADLWYFKPMRSIGFAPQSPGYATAAEARAACNMEGVS